MLHKKIEGPSCLIIPKASFENDLSNLEMFLCTLSFYNSNQNSIFCLNLHCLIFLSYKDLTICGRHEMY
jgi:hypothetical protein